MKFAVQIVYDDTTMSVSAMSENEIIKITNESDFNGVAALIVWDMSEVNKAKRLTYKGWQPRCLIQYVDEDGNVIISGYGEDH